MERSNENSLSIFDTDLGAIFSAGAMFTARGFSHSTIGTLVIGGIYVDERAAKEIAPSCASASDYALKAITFEIP